MTTIELTKATFEAQLQTVFRLRSTADSNHELQLVEVKEARLDPRYECFALTFRGDREQLLEQRTYPVSHAAIGEFDLFITPIARNHEGTFYEAVFNRLQSGS